MFGVYLLDSKLEVIKKYESSAFLSVNVKKKENRAYILPKNDENNQHLRFSAELAKTGKLFRGARERKVPRFCVEKSFLAQLKEAVVAEGVDGLNSLKVIEVFNLDEKNFNKNVKVFGGCGFFWNKYVHVFLSKFFDLNIFVTL